MDDLNATKERYIKVATAQAQKIIELLKSDNISSLDFAAWTAGNIADHLNKLVAELKKNEKQGYTKNENQDL